MIFLNRKEIGKMAEAIVIAGLSFLFGVLSQMGFAFHCINSIEKKLDLLEKSLYRSTGEILENKKSQSENCVKSEKTD